MALSPNYGWAEPDNSSLVKNGAQDIRALGDAIDTSVWNIGYGQAGKNKFINGDFRIWQRGTSTTLTTSSTFYSADRFECLAVHSSGTATATQQTFTPGTAPVAGYEGSFFLRLTAGAGGSPSAYLQIAQKIEDVRTFAAQTVTLSFYAKASVNTTITPLFQQNFGSGGSANVNTTNGNLSVTTSWTRFNLTVAIPSISGKTVGASSFLAIYLIQNNVTNSQTIDFWGVQIEYGSKATPFQTATGTIQGELAACQRYFYQWTTGADKEGSIGFYQSATAVYFAVPFPATMRTTPSVVAASGTNLYYALGAGGYDNFNSVTAFQGGTNNMNIRNTTEASGTAGGAALFGGSAAGASIAFSAEL
jgi:hypothetical protein